MKLPNIHPLFYISIIVVMALILLTKKWQCAPAYHGDDKLYLQEQTRIRDSAKRSNANLEFVYKQDSTRWQKEKDTFKVKLATTYKLLTGSQRVTADLSAKVILSKRVKDTANYIHACDSLAEENANLNYLMNVYIVYSDTVSRANDSLLRVAETRKTEVDQLNRLLFAQADKSDTLYNNLYKDYLKVSKKVGKKFTVGVGAGVGLTSDGKPGASIGITVSRTIFRL